MYYGLLASQLFLFPFICIVASKVIQNFVNINFKNFFLHSFWWTSNFSLWIKGTSYGFKSYYLKVGVICFLWLSTSLIYLTKKLQNIIPVTQETVGSFCQDSLDIDYAFQLFAAYFRQQKDNTFNSFISLSF